MHSVLDKALNQIGQIIVGNPQALRLALCCLLAKGHLLIEDLPGVGKTTLAHALARVLGLEFNRIQFTSDLLPADIIGVSIFEQQSNRFRFQPGPIFASVVLADEINRATPKAQSALLEAMEERQVTNDGETHRLPQPFFVIATQNPRHQIGTFPLPESQLDRFLMRIELGYPGRKAERGLLTGGDRRTMLSDLQPTLSGPSLLKLQQRVDDIRTSTALLDYVQDIIEATRRHPDFNGGLSPRAGLGLLRSARAWALMEGRDMVLPEDVQTVLEPVANHRLQANEQAATVADQIRSLSQSVAVA
ncbi:MAG: MoxR family ATPase [Gammaproteobacteria bacterium]|nr:MoxR family ATPase [Gammaproteobacteria bacterium]